MNWYFIALIAVGLFLFIFSIFFFFKMKNEKEEGKEVTKNQKSMPIISGIVGLIMAFVGLILGMKKEGKDK